MNEAPPFWWQKPGLAAFFLAPLSWIYSWITGRRMALKSRYVSSVPVLCVGNFVAGGAGKTPTAIAIARGAEKQGHKPGFLSRGYGGRIGRATIVDLTKHNSHDVGDEPPLLANCYPTVVSPDRTKGAQLLEQQGIDFIIMDDGFQNPSLHKDYSIVVVDSARGVGNGFAMPAGPLRVALGTQLARADAVLVIGQQSGADGVIRAAAKRAKPVYQAFVKIVNSRKWKGKKVLAFAGIADPEKFFSSLREAGADIVEARSFGDHHPFTKEEADDILFFAKRTGLEIVTTSKDAARLNGLGRVQTELSGKASILKIELKFESERILAAIIENTIERARTYRLHSSR